MASPEGIEGDRQSGWLFGSWVAVSGCCALSEARATVLPLWWKQRERPGEPSGHVGAAPGCSGSPCTAAEVASPADAIFSCFRHIRARIWWEPPSQLGDTCPHAVSSCGGERDLSLMALLRRTRSPSWGPPPCDLM